ncbi:hypothetical protein CTRI78_v000031 [Colletotrichum trifolii]|uniref:Rhodopsin domain-containing protein n=1 Tax=Colletotrichum trifolii TaxID=5466 RepID=A0A4R8RSL5_COLTR|nr:hypothetical protein CTRI78_v000031 [Colletotrichum trifolii]
MANNLGLNLTHPTAPATLPVTVQKELDDANVPVFLTGIILPHAVCTLFLFVRVASRTWVLKKWFLDDTLIFLSWLFSTALCVVYSITATTPTLLAAPAEATLQKDDNPYIMRTYLGLIYYQLCLCLTKFSVLAFYLRVFTSRPRERWLAWGTVAFVFLYSVPMLLMSFLQCHPIIGEFFGQPMLCFGFPDLLISSASLHSATDAWLIIMVIPCVARLDLPRKQKIALAMVLSLSIFVIAASMVRLQLSLHRHYRPSSAGITNTLTFFVMTVLECDLALICASAPTLRPLLARMFPVMMSTAKRRSLEAAENDSFDLTSLTYHGYPWTEPTTPFARSRNASYASHLNKLRMPAPPVPVLSITHMAPTTLSLRTAVLGVTPRRPPRPPMGEDKPILDENWEFKRSSSIYSTDVPYEEVEDRRVEQNDGVVLKQMRLSLGSAIKGHGDFGYEKQLPPTSNRMSHVSGLSGDTYAADRNSGTSKSGKESGNLTTETYIPIPPKSEKRKKAKRPN